jgi:RNA polymerase sigma-70 factor (ECF subfamily)
MSAEVSDGDLVQLAREGDPVAFRLLIERHQPMARARAGSLCPRPADVDDVVQESFLRAFTALDRLRDPDRFAGWLAGIVLNVCRGLQRRPPVTLLADWPEPLHRASADGLPSAEDLDRADALRVAVADLPAGQRRAVTLHYYAGLPPGQISEPPGAARASLHKARVRLRAYITEHRPDLIPAARRTHMTTVRITRTERRIPPGPVPDRFPTHVIVLADDTGSRELPIWLLGRDSHRFSQLFESPDADAERAGTAKASIVQASTVQARTAEELTSRLLRAAGASVTGVEIDELGPEVTAARIEVAGPDGTQHVTARLPDGLAIAITAGAPIRVADAVMDRLAAPVPGEHRPGPVPEQTARDLSLGSRPRYEPRNLTFADGLDRWALGGSFDQHASQAHWHDYSCAAEDGTAVLYSAVARPEGFAFLGQEIYADDYLRTTIVFHGQFRTQDTANPPGRAGLFVRVRTPLDIRGPMTEEAMLADPNNHIATIAGGSDWAGHEVTARIPDDANTIVFGIFLAGPGRMELRDPELTRGTS